MRYFPLWAALVAAAPSAGAAQSLPRLYVGASAALLRLDPFYDHADTRLGPAATIGLQLGPRWAVETGAQMTWQRREFTIYPASSAPAGYTVNRLTTLVVPLLARYTITAAKAPVQVDVLAGASLLRQAWHDAYDYSRGSQTVHSEVQYSSNYFCVGLGPQLRYAWKSNLAVKLTAPLNLRLTMLNTFGFERSLFINPQLGVQYILGS